MKKIIFILSIILLTSNSQAKLIEEILAVVEGEMILKSDLESLDSRLKKETLIDSNLLNLLNLSKVSTKSKKLNYLISKKIISIASKKEQGFISKEDLAQKELQALSSKNKMSITNLKKEISKRGIKFSEYKDFIAESSLVRTSLERNVISKARPTEEDFISYLKFSGVKKIDSTFSYDLKQIFIPKKNKSSLKIAKKISNLNFNNYFFSAEQFGIESLDLGKLNPSDLSQSHRIVLKELSEGDISPIVYEKNGYRIFYVKIKEGKYNIPNTPLVRSLQKKFYDQLIKKHFTSWLEELKRKSFVRIN